MAKNKTRPVVHVPLSTKQKLEAQDKLTKHKIYVYESHIYIEIYDLFNDKKPEEVIEAVTSAITKLKEKNKLVFIQVEPYGHDGGFSTVAYTYRLENEAEYKQRQIQAAKILLKQTQDAEKLKKAELAEYKKLHEKYGDLVFDSDLKM